MNGDAYFSNLYDLLMCITKAVDLVSPEVTDHHQQVAYLTYHIADVLRLSLEQKRSLITAAFLHDVGAIASQDKLDLMEVEHEHIHDHALLGAKLLADFPVFADVSTVIKFHHVPWDNGAGRVFRGENVPMMSHILHLADRIAVRIRRGECIISQIQPIKEYVQRERGSLFVPEYADAFLSICDREALWLDLTYQPAASDIVDISTLSAVRLTVDEVVDLTRIFARIIDFRSSFTAMHSAGVAAAAVKLAELSGLSEDECKMMNIAGNLHDIGKLAIPREILEKQDKLEPAEYDVIRSHSYYTYRLLKPVEGFGEITQWAAYHHEKLNGRGYPFRLEAHSLSLGARIMAVADIFTAITEDRPYRTGMPKERAEAVLTSMVNSGGISPEICSLLLRNYGTVAGARRSAAEKAVDSYARFLQGSVPAGGGTEKAEGKTDSGY